MKTKIGLTGKVARAFIRSKLTLLIVVASILLGLGAVVMLPREEEPQIIVPMIDVFVQMPGASAKEVEERVTRPMEKLLWEVPGVEYIYSTSSPGMAMAVVRFYVGQNEEDAIVRLNQKMLSNFDLIPPGASQPLVKPRSIDDVPILALTLSSDRYDHFTLRRVAAQVHDQIKEINDVSEVKVIGGGRRQIRVLLDGVLMAAHNVAPAAIVPALERSNRQSQSGGFSSGNREFLVETGGFLHSAEEVGAVVIGVFNDRPVYLRDVAKIEDGPEEPADYVMFGLGDGASKREPSNPQSAIRNPQSAQPAVTISVAKRKGVNAIEIADKVLEKVEHLKGDLIPSEVTVTTTRNYGKTASEKSNGLLLHIMNPIPIGATAAMLFSLLVAFIVMPWASARLFKKRNGRDHGGGEEGSVTKLYRVVMGKLIRAPKWRYGFLIGVVLLLLASMSLAPLKLVRLKMLPFDNKSEFQVIIDMPEGAPLEQTAAVTREIGDYIRTVPEVTDYQMYVGTASPYNFNGLVRHYFLRRGPHVADIQVNLVGKDERDSQSHDIAKRVRPVIQLIAAKYGARVKVAEVPPGPPVLQTLVAEIYGPDYQRQIEIARQIRDIFDKTPGVKEDVPITLRLAPVERSGVEDLKQIKVIGRHGNLVPLGELVRVDEGVAEKSIYHKNLMPVTYVTGDVAGGEESPVYAILILNEAIEQLKLPEGYSLERHFARQPFLADKYAMKWDGEWHITYEVFRDLGVAFAAVLALIYILVVGWFQSFKTPLTIMAAIPFSLVGILPAHALMGAFFTAPSMIGFIAGAGIVVRNSIILVDFVELRLKQGMSLAEAVIDAGAVRFRPMMLTAAAVVVGSLIILFDPIFQGLAISLMAGEIASLLLSRMTVPILYYLSERGKHAPAETAGDFLELRDSTPENHASPEVEVGAAN